VSNPLLARILIAFVVIMLILSLVLTSIPGPVPL
jgi:hypothetical protein